MEAYKINTENIDVVSSFMAGIKPESWDYEGAKQQLSK